MIASKFDLDTPALLVDIEPLERNLRRMAGIARAANVDLIPHFKVHKSLAIARRQIEQGAIGISCAKLGEAEVLIKGGIQRVLIANQIVGEQKYSRLMDLMERAEVIVAVDDEHNICELARSAAGRQLCLPVMLEVNIGLNRCGVSPNKAAHLASLVARHKSLRFRGIMGYEGHAAHMQSGPEKDGEIRESISTLLRAKEAIESAGVPVTTISAGGTGTYHVTSEFAAVTELQVGAYSVMDLYYAGHVTGDFELTLSVLVTVISKPEPNRAVIDAGWKGADCLFGKPQVKGLSGVSVTALHAEHGILSLDSASGEQVKVGDKLELSVYLADPTVNLYSTMYCTRDNEVLDAWAIEGRGKVQ